MRKLSEMIASIEDMDIKALATEAKATSTDHLNKAKSGGRSRLNNLANKMADATTEKEGDQTLF